MALTALVADGDDVNAAKVNQFAAAIGKAGVLLAYGRVYYNGAAWVLDSTHDSHGLSSPVFAANTLTLTLSNLAAPAIPHAQQQHGVTTLYLVRVHTPDATSVQIQFYNVSTGAVITSPDTSMDVYILVIGA